MSKKSNPPSSSRSFLAAAAALAATAALAGCSGADRDSAFFIGKTVTVVVPHGPGGMDTYARLVAPYIQKNLPGSRVEVVNEPGGGGIAGRNRVFAAPPDGLTLGFTTFAGTLLAEWARQPGVGYAASRFSIVGRVNAEAHVLVAFPGSGIARLADLAPPRRARVGFAGLGSDDYYVGTAAARILGFAIEARSRYSSVNDAGLACVRGEVDAMLFSYSSVHPLIEAGTARPVAVFGENRLADIPEVPTVFETAPPAVRDLLRAVVRLYELDRALFGPPGIPESRLRALRRAMARASADEELVKSAAKLERPLAFLSGAEVDELLRGVLASEARIKPMVREAGGGRE